MSQLYMYFSYIMYNVYCIGVSCTSVISCILYRDQLYFIYIMYIVQGSAVHVHVLQLYHVYCIGISCTSVISCILYRNQLYFSYMYIMYIVQESAVLQLYHAAMKEQQKGKLDEARQLYCEILQSDIIHRVRVFWLGVRMIINMRNKHS